MLPGPDPAAKVKVRLLAEPTFVSLGRWRYKGGKVTLFQRQQPGRILVRAPRLTQKP
jgi:hypothetical protein